jgi:hypothetical protein
MRRLALALCFTLLLAPAVFAEQAQTVPPQAAPPAGRPTTPGAVAPAPQAPPTMPPSGQQTPRPGVSPTAAPPQGAPPATQSGQNVQLTVAISDSLSAEVQSKKTVTMLTSDGHSGQIRSSSPEGLITIDARPSIGRDGRIFLQLTVEYRPELSPQQLQQSGASRLTMFTESLSLIVSDSKPVIASQSADPRSERKVSLEVTATIVK